MAEIINKEMLKRMVCEDIDNSEIEIVIEKPMTIREQQRMGRDVTRLLWRFDEIEKRYNYLKGSAVDEAMGTVEDAICELMEAIREYKGEPND